MGVEELDLTVYPMFSAMTERGMLVDRDALRRLQVDVRAQAEEQLALVEHFTERPGLNPMSGDQVADWLGTVVTGRAKLTKSRKRLATDERALVMVEHPAVDAILDYRGLVKLDTTFIEGTLRASAKDGRVHPRWRLTKVRSGRAAVGNSEDDNEAAFSDDALNMMAVPARDDLGRRLRSCFVADEGYDLFSIDYSQIEPRLAAALSGDSELLTIYRMRRDIYDEVAAKLFKATIVAKGAAGRGVWEKTRRTPAKIVTLGVFYGMMGDKLYEELIKWGCGMPSSPMFTREECAAMIEQWFDIYPGVKELAQDVVRRAKLNFGWVETAGGRRRLLPALFLPGYSYPEDKLRAEAERQGFNHVIQGTAQEQMKQGMKRAWDMRDLLPFEPLLQIHDELIGQTRMGFKVSELAETMECVVSCKGGGSLTLKTEYKVAKTWGELK